MTRGVWIQPSKYMCGAPRLPVRICWMIIAIYLTYGADVIDWYWSLYICMMDSITFLHGGVWCGALLGVSILYYTHCKCIFVSLHCAIPHIFMLQFYTSTNKANNTWTTKFNAPSQKRYILCLDLQEYWIYIISTIYKYIHWYILIRYTVWVSRWHNSCTHTGKKRYLYVSTIDVKRLVRNTHTVVCSICFENWCLTHLFDV